MKQRKQRHGSCFLIIASPELKTKIREFRESVAKFLEKSTTFTLFFDNKFDIWFKKNENL